MFKKIILSLLATTLLITSVSSADAKNYNCGTVWNNFNQREHVSKEEFRTCRTEIIKAYKIEIRGEYQIYKENKNYCKDKYIEISYRRSATFIEDRLCGKQFKKFRQAELDYKYNALKSRGIVYGR